MFIAETSAEICSSYVQYLISRYGCKEKITVVFDGGYLEPSTKDTTHLRRSRGKVGRKIIPTLTNTCAVKKDAFLLNNHNKHLFLLMLGQQLTNAGIEVRHANGDADAPIVFTALEIAQQQGPVTVVGEDTDLLILLLHHYHIGIHSPVYLYSNASKMAWNIGKANSLLGVELNQSILAIHTLCGCDTTSRIQSIGLQSILNKFLKNKELRSSLKRFSSGSISKDRVLQVGESILLILLGAKKEKTLDELRSRKYFDKLVGASRRAVTPQALGPTTNAAQQHILRVYFQIEVWKGESDLNALDWGWKMTHRSYAN